MSLVRQFRPPPLALFVLSNERFLSLRTLRLGELS